MTKTLKLILIMTMLILLFAMLFACSNSAKETGFVIEGDFKTEYLIGETPDLSGMVINVAYDDGTTKKFDVDLIRDKLKFVNFDTTSEGLSKPVTVEYNKKLTTVFYIQVLSEGSSTIKFNVTFETNDADFDIEPIEVSALSTIPIPEDPERSGYFFDGWYQESSLTNKWNFATTKITGDVTLYAKWGKFVTVYFADPNGNIFVDLTRTDVREGYTYLNRPQVPDRTGFTGFWDYNGEWNDLYDGQIIKANYTINQYTVTFYYTNELGESRTYVLAGQYQYGMDVNVEASAEIATLYSLFIKTRPNSHLARWRMGEFYTTTPDFSPLLSRITANLHIYAEYEADILQVTFDYDGLRESETIDVEYGTLLTEPDALLTNKDGYDFEGWYLINKKWNFKGELVNSSMTLVAKWVKLHAVTFLNFDASVYDTKYVRHMETLTDIPIAPNYIEEGYDTYWLRLEYTNIDSDQFVYPEKKIKVYTVSFIDFDGSPILVDGVAVQNIEHGKGAKYPATNPSREYYNFVGWSVANENIDRVTSSFVVVAQYTIMIFKVTIVYGYNGETVDKDVAAGSGLTISDMPSVAQNPRKELGDRYLDDTFTTVWTESVKFYNNATIYYKWYDIYFVTFSYRISDENDDRETKQVSVRENTLLTNPMAVPEIKGLSGRWTYNNLDVDFSSLYITEDITVVAEYEAARHTVVFMNGGVIFATYLVSHGSKISAPTDNPTRVGHTFKYWSNFDETKPIESDMSFGAYFEKNVYTVKFIVKPDNSFEEVVYTRSVRYEESAAVPDNPDYVKFGYRFVGWDKPYVSITEDTEINALFEKIKYVVTFYSSLDGAKLGSTEVEYGEYVAQPIDDPTVAGYTFIKWEFDFVGTVITGPRDIYATFKINSYKVTLHTNGGSFGGNLGVIKYEEGVYYIEVDYNRTFKVNIEPGLTDMAFMGWFVSNDSDAVMYDFNSLVTSEFTIYAKWEATIAGTDGLGYSFDKVNNSVTVISAPSGLTSIEIASHRMYDGISRKVTSIASAAFKDMTTLTSVSIPKTVTDIGSGAFQGCIGLQSITIPESVVRIAENAFMDCISLENVTIPINSALKSIGSFAFCNNKKLGAITFPSSLTEIGNDAFNGAASLINIVIPQNVIDIGERAFFGCLNLKYAKFMRETSPNLGVSAFAYCPDYFRIYVNSLSNYANSSNNKIGWKEINEKGILHTLSSITPDGLWSYQYITSGENAQTVSIVQYLGNETKLKLDKINILIGSVPTEVRISSVGAHAFDKQIEELEFSTEIAMHNDTLTSTTSLKHLVVKIMPSFIIEKSIIYRAFELPNLFELTVSANGLTLWEVFGRTPPPSLKVVNIMEESGSTPIVIPKGMFNNNYTIEKVTLPKNVVEIGDEAFINCISLTELHIMNEIGNESMLVSIGARAFYGAVKLLDLNIPSSVVSIGVDALYNTIYLNNNQAEFVMIGDGILYKYQGSASKVEINQTIVKVINDEAFKNNTSIVGVVHLWTINASDSRLVRIGENAFEGCINLEYVAMPETLTSIDDNAFLNAIKLSKLVLFSSNKVTGGKDMFLNTMNGFEVYAAFQNKIDDADEDNTDLDSNWAGVVFNRIYDPLMNANWIYSHNTSSTRTYLIQSVTENTTIDLPTAFANIPVVVYENYLLTRATKNLTIPISVIIDGANTIDVEYSMFTFAGLSRLETLTLLNTNNIALNGSPLNAILYQLLQRNSNLTKITVPGTVSLKDIFGTTDLPATLNHVEIANGTTDIVDEMFKDFVNIKNITFPASLSVDNIGIDAFKNCGWTNEFLGDFVYIDSLKLLVGYKGNDNIIRIPNGIEYINKYALYQNDFIEVITLPQSLTHIYENAFAGMSRLVKVIAEGSLTITINSDIFNHENNSGLEMFVRDSLTNSYTLNNVIIVSDTDIIFDYQNKYFYKDLGNDEIILLQYYKEKETAFLDTEIDGKKIISLGNNVFTATVTQIQINAAFGVSDFTFINLKNIVSKLIIKDVDIYKDDPTAVPMDFSERVNDLISTNTTLTTLAYDASIRLADLLKTTDFKTHLITIEVLNGTENVVSHMLDSAIRISNIILPNSIKTIGHNAFEDTAWYKSQNDYVKVLNDTMLYKYKGISNIVVIPSNIEIINDYAFSHYSKDGSIEKWQGINNLTKVNFQPGSVIKEIRQYAFKNCENLTSIDVVDSMQKIEHSAFDGTLIGYDSDGFMIASGDYSQTIIGYNGSEKDVIIPIGIKYINYQAFKGSDIESVSFVEGALIRRIMDEAFMDCTALVSFDLDADSSINYIGRDVFAETPWYNSITEPIVTINSNGIETLVLYVGTETEITFGEAGTPLENIDIISLGAFNAINYEFDIKFISELPLNIEKGVFDKVRYIFVPTNSEAVYKSMWSAYIDKIKTY